MSELSPCPACRRHVRGITCPFCGAATAQRAAIDLGAGRVSRAIVFASATLAATAGCAHKQKSADEMGEERHAGGNGCIPPDDDKIKQLEARKAELQKQQSQESDETQKYATEQEIRQVDEDLQHARMPNCAPYGAPPARRRIV